MRGVAAMVCLAIGCGGTNAGDSDLSLTVASDRAEATADGTDAIQLIVRVAVRSLPAPDVPVSFTVERGLLLAATPATDANGVVVATVRARTARTYTVGVAVRNRSSLVTVRFVERSAPVALRFSPLPASVAAGESFDVVVGAVDALGRSAKLPGPVSLSVREFADGGGYDAQRPARVALSAKQTAAAATEVTFSATLDGEALDVVLVATAGDLHAESPRFDVRATRQVADWRLLGAEGAPVWTLLASPVAPQTLVLAQPSGRLLVTTDGARSWTRAGAEGLPSAQLISSAWCTDGSLYLSMWDRGAFRSRDAGATFERIAVETGVISCDFDGTRPFLASPRQTPALSRWNGNSFAGVVAPPGSVSAAPGGDALYLASFFGGILRSSDDGATWTATAMTETRSFVLAVSPQIALTLQRGALDRTADGGATWTRLFADGIAAVTRSPSGGLVLLDTHGGIRRSSDGGATWSALTGALPQQGWTALVETEAGTWAGSALGVFVLEGGTFRLATAGMGGLPAQIATDPRTGFTYVAYILGLYRLRGAGAWELVLPGPVADVRFDPSAAGAMFCTGPGGFLRSTDAGATWSALSGAPGLPFADPDGRTWYAYGDGLWRSDDAGATWTGLWRWDIGRPTVSGMAFGPGVAVFVSNEDGKMLPGIFRSEDRGATYARTSPARGQLLQVGSTLFLSSEVRRSEDFGRTFTALFPGHLDIAALALDFAHPEVLYAVDPQYPRVQPAALFRSGDGGVTWSRCLSGLDRLEVTGLVVDPTDSSVLYAATRTGVYRAANPCP